MHLGRYVVAAGLVLGVAGAVPAKANSIVLNGTNGPNFFYGFDVTSPVAIQAGGTITLTGLADVTGLSTSIPQIFSTSFTDTTATLTNSTGLTQNLAPGLYDQVFDIVSSAPAIGNVLYAASTTTGVVSGTVQGPVAAVTTSVTPEPASFALLGTGLLGVAGVVRRRIA